MSILTILLLIIVITLLIRHTSTVARIAGWLFIASAALGITHAGLTGHVIAHLSIGLTLLILGHVLYARAHGHYKSRIIGTAATRLRLHPKSDNSAESADRRPATAQPSRALWIAKVALAFKFPFLSTVARGLRR